MKNCVKCGVEFNEGELVKVYRVARGSNAMEELGDIDFMCSDCLNNLLETKEVSKCIECGEHFYTNILINTENGLVCGDCRNDLYRECGNCQTIVRMGNDDRMFHGTYYCEHCLNLVRDSYIMGYNEEHGTQFIPIKLDNEDEPKYYFGTELEVECSQYDMNTRRIVPFIKRSVDCVVSQDGSLDRGFEIVQQPLSYNYIMTEDYKNRLSGVMQKLQEFNYSSHDSGHCGLHVHVTRPQNDKVVDRIWHIMETYKTQLGQFARRSNSRWANYLSDKCGINNDRLTSLYYIKSVKGSSDMDRYMALNTQNKKTIEFRIFRGTLNIDTYLATIELVHNIVTLCDNVKIPLKNITWSRLTSTPYAKAYCESKGITTDIIPTDTSREEFKRVQIERQARRVLNTYMVRLERKLVDCANVKIKVVGGNIQDKLREKYCQVDWCNDRVYDIEYVKSSLNRTTCTIKDNISEIGRVAERIQSRNGEYVDQSVIDLITEIANYCDSLNN